jgi:hypothetical protein
MIKSISIGFDPGSSSGGISVIIETNNGTLHVEDSAMDKLTDKGMYSFVKKYVDMAPDKTKAIIENVHSMPGQGVSSTFKFGRNKGMLEMICIALEIPTKLEAPRTWQKTYGIKKDKEETKTEWKKRLRVIAERIYPKVKFTNPTVDSLLIAEYCRKYFK